MNNLLQKRIIGIILSVLLIPCIAGNLLLIASADETSEYRGFGYEHQITSEQPFLFMDFNNYDKSAQSDYEFDNFDKNAPIFPQSDNDEHGNYFSGNGYFYPEKRFEKPITEGTYLFSFDIKRSVAAYFCYLVSYTSTEYEDTTGNFFYSFGLSANRIGYLRNWVIQNPKELIANDWYHVAMFMDFDLGKIMYYINNEYIGESLMSGDFYGFSFFTEGTVDNITSFDNIAIYKVTPELSGELEKLGVAVPDGVRSPFQCAISSEFPANLFKKFDDVSLDINCSNRLKQDVEYDISYVAKDYKGDIVWTDEKKGLKAKAEETFSDKITPKVGRYDIYTLYVTVTPKDEDLLPTKEDREFSVVHAPTPGYKSKFFGAQDHPGINTDWNFLKYAIDTMGIGYIRTDFSWGTYEAKKGIYGGQSAAERNNPNYYTELKALGIKPIIIWYPNYNIYGTGDSTMMSIKEMSKNPEVLEAYRKASESIAAKYKDTISIFELGNELNHARAEVLSPEEYAIVAKAGYDGLKKGNPNCTVLCHGISRSAADWTYRYLMSDAGKSCDVIAIHLYQEAGTPESKMWDVYCKETRDMVDRAGYPDMEMWITEGNTSAQYSYNTEPQHGVNLVRQFAQIEAYRVQDKFMFYAMQTDEERPDDIESYFGIVRGGGSKNNGSPKQSYMAGANYIAMTENAVFENDIQEGNVWLLRFKKANGKHMVMMYADRECKYVSLDLGASKGVLYDINGNSTDVASADGKYTFAITDQPVYFEYEGEKFEKCADVVTVDKNVIELTAGSADKFSLKIPEGAEIEAVGRDNVAVTTEKNGTDAKVKIAVKRMPGIRKDPALGFVTETAYTERRHDFGTQLYRDFIDVRITYGGNMICYLPLPVEYVYEEADIIMTVEPYDNTNTKFWKGIVDIKNNNTNRPISGKIVITSPGLMAEKIDPITVTSINPGEKRDFVFNIPVECSRGWMRYRGTFVADDGEEIEFELGDIPRSSEHKSASGAAFTTLQRNRGEAPVIDGIINEDEWRDYKLKDFDKSEVSFGSQGIVTAGVAEAETFGEDADYGGLEDFSGTIYSKWDDKFIYCAAIVHDDIHYQKQEPVRLYFDDEFFLTLMPTTTQRHDTRIDVALTEFFDVDVFNESDRGPVVYRNWSEMFGVPVGGVIPQSDDGFKAAILRKNNTTIYEVQMPWDQIVSKDTFIRKQCYIAFGIRDYDGDRDKTFVHDGWFVLVDTKK